MAKKEVLNDVQWLTTVEEHDFPAAKSYLSIIYDANAVIKMVAGLRTSNIVQFKAKDIFRASGLSLLGVSNSHVAKNTKKIAKGVQLSPLLLIRDSVNGKVVVADGYHRLCAVYAYNEDALIPCKIA